MHAARLVGVEPLRHAEGRLLVTPVGSTLLRVLEAAVAVALGVAEARGRRAVPRRLARVSEARLAAIDGEVAGRAAVVVAAAQVHHMAADDHRVELDEGEAARDLAQRGRARVRVRARVRLG